MLENTSRVNIKEVAKRMKSNIKEHKQIRYYFYMKWAIELLKKAGFDIDFDIKNKNDNPCYSYPKIILNVLREIAPGNIVGEIREVYILFLMYNTFIETADLLLYNNKNNR